MKPLKDIKFAADFLNLPVPSIRGKVSGRKFRSSRLVGVFCSILRTCQSFVEKMKVQPRPSGRCNHDHPPTPSARPCNAPNPTANVTHPNRNVHCPAHDDPTPSLSVIEKDGKILVYCHGGCPQDRVLSALKAKAYGLPVRGPGTPHCVKRSWWPPMVTTTRRAPSFLRCASFATLTAAKHFSQRRPLLGGGSILGIRAGEYQCFDNSATWYPVGRKGPDPMAAVKKFPAAQLVPYRLPELLAADPAALVFAPEGEKDV